MVTIARNSCEYLRISRVASPYTACHLKSIRTFTYDNDTRMDTRGQQMRVEVRQQVKEGEKTIPVTSYSQLSRVIVANFQIRIVLR